MRPVYSSKRQAGGRSTWRGPGQPTGLVLLALLTGLLGPASAGGQTAPLPQIDLAQPNTSVPNTSVFTDSPGVAKDPFFPQSKRRPGSVGKLPLLTNEMSQAVIEGLRLQGRSGTPDKPLAIINNVTLGVGEEGNVRVGASLLKIRCIQIRDRSVIIRINGKNRELSLRPSL